MKNSRSNAHIPADCIPPVGGTVNEVLGTPDERGRVTFCRYWWRDGRVQQWPKMSAEVSSANDH